MILVEGWLRGGRGLKTRNILGVDHATMGSISVFFLFTPMPLNTYYGRGRNLQNTASSSLIFLDMQTWDYGWLPLESNRNIYLIQLLVPPYKMKAQRLLEVALDQKFGILCPYSLKSELKSTLISHCWDFDLPTSGQTRRHEESIALIRRSLSP